MDNQGRGSPLDESRIERATSRAGEAGGKYSESSEKLARLAARASGNQDGDQSWEAQKKWCKEMRAYIEELEQKLARLTNDYVDSLGDLTKAGFLLEHHVKLINDGLVFDNHAKGILADLEFRHVAYTKYTLARIGRTQAQIDEAFRSSPK